MAERAHDTPIDIAALVARQILPFCAIFGAIAVGLVWAGVFTLPLPV